ncbi:MAG TPA: hypothetical protein VGC89_02400 [Pyrinomonadaceae bacterium]
MSFAILPFVLIVLKAAAVLAAFALFLSAAGWLLGADSIALPGLGLIIATPLLLIFMALVKVALLIAALFLSALAK